MANDTNRYGFTYDSNLVLKDPGLIAASAAGQVNGKNQLIDVGDGVYWGAAVIDWTACEVDSSNELYTVSVQGALRGTGSTRDVPVLDTSHIENLAMADFGHTSVRKGAAETSPSSGRMILPFRNVVADTTYQILRAYITVAGTIATGFNVGIWIGKLPI